MDILSSGSVTYQPAKDCELYLNDGVSIRVELYGITDWYIVEERIKSALKRSNVFKREKFWRYVDAACLIATYWGLPLSLFIPLMYLFFK